MLRLQASVAVRLCFQESRMVGTVSVLFLFVLPAKSSKEILVLANFTGNKIIFHQNLFYIFSQVTDIKVAPCH